MSDTTEDDKIRQQSISTSPSAQQHGPHSRPSSRPKAHIRVSLACVQCRSKHVKCDATLPACLRCQAEAKPCFYAKSRRGIRDPKKRSMISDRPPRSHSGHSSQPEFSKSPVPEERGVSPARPHARWPIVQPPAITDGDTLVDLFYKHFHPAHPFLPPRRFFASFFDADSDSHRFLLTAMRYCGSLYSKDVALETLKEMTFTTACGLLPMTPQSVQGLLLLSIIASGQAWFEYHAGWLDKAWSMAKDIGMQSKTFAGSTPNPVLAESFRRTWFHLIIYQSVKFMTPMRSKIQPVDLEHDVDLPCEEWEYDAGVSCIFFVLFASGPSTEHIWLMVVHRLRADLAKKHIPPPLSMAEFESRKNSNSKAEFSSMAYLIDICNIRITLILPYLSASDDRKRTLFERADSKTCDWLRRLPRWKLDLVDQDGNADLVIHLATNFAHLNRLRLRQATLRSGLNLREYFHFGPANGPYKRSRMVHGAGWKFQPFELQAADGACDMFRYAVPILSLHPAAGSAILVVVLAYLDACVFLGLDSETLRDKINMLLHVLSVHGETWELSRMIAEEVRSIMEEYLSHAAPESDQESVSAGDEHWDPVAAAITMEQVAGGLLHESILPPQPLHSPGLVQVWDPAVTAATWLGVTTV